MNKRIVHLSNEQLAFVKRNDYKLTNLLAIKIDEMMDERKYES